MPYDPSLRDEGLAWESQAPLHEPVRSWFRGAFVRPSPAQVAGLGPIASGATTLLLAPTGSGKTLTAFLSAIDRIMFSPEPPRAERCRVVYVSPLRALAADIERNLRVPIAGISEHASRAGIPFTVPNVFVRTSDTPARERARAKVRPPDILITTPESLYLLLTSQARAMLSSVEVVIIDEIHALVPTKRGAHLFVSLERLEALRPPRARPLQRIGLSATQRPLDEVSRLLGGFSRGPDGVHEPRPVKVVDAGTRKLWDLRVEVTALDMAPAGRGTLGGSHPPRKRGANPSLPSAQPADSPEAATSIWPSIQARLLELVRSHRSTMIFTNGRRAAERLSAALNEAAGEEISLSHHGSVAKDRRKQIEERLKRGELSAIVATSSLELGIDIGAVDLVVQVEAPPSVAAGLQRVGRAGHQVGQVSRGVLLPKYRGDLLVAAATTERMKESAVEETFYPRNPLDVLAQQIVAIVCEGPKTADWVYDLVRAAAPYEGLSRSSFDAVLDMLSGRYPSDEFAELRPRITYDRKTGHLRARDGAKSIAILSGGTIPDRGLYGVFLAESSDSAGSLRVGELDEEMVFESRVGDVFLLGASSWRIVEITHDRVLVVPAPFEPAKLPFWHGDRPGRPLELGRAVGALARTIAEMHDEGVVGMLRERHGLDELSASTLLRYVRAQVDATSDVPSDRTIVVERHKDEFGDYRVCILSPFGSRVHQPWCLAVLARWRREVDRPIDGIPQDDGIVFRLPATEGAPSFEHFLPAALEVEDLVAQSLGGSSLFAARFRENAGRALLFPRRSPTRRSPLWATRKKAADLLAVVSRYPSFPIVLETFRECLRDVFDLPGLAALLRDIEAHAVRVVTVDTRVPSPFASSLLFSFVGNFMYAGDVPLAEHRARALAVDPAELKSLLGTASLRELLDRDAILEVERSLQRIGYAADSADKIHDGLLLIGDLSAAEIAQRTSLSHRDLREILATLEQEGRILSVTIAGDNRYIAVEDAVRMRDALGVALPDGLSPAWLLPVADPLGDLLSRYARTHGPFEIAAPARRFGLSPAVASEIFERLAQSHRVIFGEFLPGGSGVEVCAPDVLRAIKRLSLEKARKDIQPVEAPVLGRFYLRWQGIEAPRRGLEALALSVERLRGAPLLASALERDVLRARVEDYRPHHLDHLTASGEVVWVGVGRVGASDGRIALIPADELSRLCPLAVPTPGELAGRVRSLLERRGALFFSDLVSELGGFPQDLLGVLWEMVWASEVTNDTMAPLRAILRKKDRKTTDLVRRRGLFASRMGLGHRTVGPAGSEGRWSLVPRGRDGTVTESERRVALTQAMLDRYGVLTREAVQAEEPVGGFSVVYDVLKAMEEAGRVRRGYFVEGLGATQFALAGADDLLRSLRDRFTRGRVTVLAATDPANPYGAALPWPPVQTKVPLRPQRSASAIAILLDGTLIGYHGQREEHLLTFLPQTEQTEFSVAEALAEALGSFVDETRGTIVVRRIDGHEARESGFGPQLVLAGFSESSKGYMRRPVRTLGA